MKEQQDNDTKVYHGWVPKGVYIAQVVRVEPVKSTEKKNEPIKALKLHWKVILGPNTGSNFHTQIHLNTEEGRKYLLSVKYKMGLPPESIHSDMVGKCCKLTMDFDFWGRSIAKRIGKVPPGKIPTQAKGKGL